MLEEAAAEWRRQKGVQDAVAAARAIITAEATDSVDIAENSTYVKGSAAVRPRSAYATCVTCPCHTH